jgi:hypothetical protein
VVSSDDKFFLKPMAFFYNREVGQLETILQEEETQENELEIPRDIL